MPERVDLDRIKEYRSHGYIEVAIPSIDARLKAVEEEAFRLKDELAKRGWTSVDDGLPKSDLDTNYVAKLTDSFMSSPGMYRRHPYDIVSGWYLNAHPKIYQCWMPLSETPKKESL